MNLGQDKGSTPTDITNWRKPGHNIWGFQNVDKIIQTDLISKGGEQSTLKLKLQSFLGFSLDLPDGSSLDLPSFLSQTETDGLIVLKDGIVVYEHYGRTNTERSIHATFSISKSVTGLLCGILVEQGKLDTDKLVSSYVPEMTGSSYKNVTVRQLLDMRSGVKHDDTSPGYRNATGFYPLEPGDEPTDLHSYIPTIKSPLSAPIDGLDGPPFDYISANADLLGWVIERASGKKFAEVLSETIWQPMGAESDAYVTVDRCGNARTAAGICATVRDLARLGQVILQGGRRIIPESWIKDILNNGSRAAFAAGSEKSDYEGIFDTAAYRSYWIADQDTQVLMASGTNGQLLLVDCKNGIVMTKTSSQPERTDWGKIRLNVQAFREFTRIMKGQDK